MVIVEFAKEQQPLTRDEVGELFIFKSENEWVCHRYLGTNNNEFLFKGDFSTVHEAFSRPLVLGRVYGIRARDGHMRISKGHFLKWSIVRLQRQSILSSQFFRKIWRYLAILFTLMSKAFLYHKVDPAQIIDKRF